MWMAVGYYNELIIIPHISKIFAILQQFMINKNSSLSIK